MRNGLPDRVVQEGTTACDASMKLGRDEARLALHDRGVAAPGGQQRVGFLGRDNERVDQHDRTIRVVAKLIGERDAPVHFLKFGHIVFLGFGMPT